MPRATAVSVDPTGLTNVTATDVQGAIEDLDAASGGGSALTVQDENSNVSTSVTQIDFQGAGVTASSGTGEVVVTIPGGSSGGSQSPWYLSRKALHGTYGDDFSGTSLNGRWTRRNIVSGDETWQAGESGVYVSGLVGGDLYLQTAPGGDFSIEVDCSQWSTATTTLIGPVIISSSGAGCAVAIRPNNGIFIINLASYVFSSYGPSLSGYSTGLNTNRVWLRLNKSSTNFTAQFSLNGQVWSPASSAQSNAFTVDRIGVGCVYSDTTGEALLSRFNVV